MKKIPLDSAELAESIRQSHCDRKHIPHKCIGVMTVTNTCLSLDCEICGQETEFLEGISAIVERARAICMMVGANYDGLTANQKRELLLEVLALAKDGL